MTFAELDRRYRELLRARQAGQLSEDDFVSQVSELTLRDDQGQWWMIGARTGKWYVWEGGSMVEATPPGLTAAPPPPDERATASQEGHTCPHCGAPLEPNARFCGNCGQAAPKPVETAPMACPNCGAELPPNARFCGNCGHRLTQDASAAPRQPPPPPPPAAPPAPDAQATVTGGGAMPPPPPAPAPAPPAGRPPAQPSGGPSAPISASGGLTPEAISSLDEPVEPAVAATPAESAAAPGPPTPPPPAAGPERAAPGEAQEGAGKPPPLEKAEPAPTGTEPPATLMAPINLTPDRDESVPSDAALPIEAEPTTSEQASGAASQAGALPPLDREPAGEADGESVAAQDSAAQESADRESGGQEAADVEAVAREAVKETGAEDVSAQEAAAEALPAASAPEDEPPASEPDALHKEPAAQGAAGEVEPEATPPKETQPTHEQEPMATEPRAKGMPPLEQTPDSPLEARPSPPQPQPTMAAPSGTPAAGTPPAPERRSPPPPPTLAPTASSAPPPPPFAASAPGHPTPPPSLGPSGVGAPPPPPPPGARSGGGTPPQPPSPEAAGVDKPKGMPWYTALLIGLGALLVVGLVYVGATRLFGQGDDRETRAKVTATIAVTKTVTSTAAKAAEAPTATHTATPEQEPTSTSTLTPTQTATPEPGAPVLRISQEGRFSQDSGAKAMLDPGDIVRYTIAVRNDGESEATGVILTVPLDTALQLVGDVEVGEGKIVRGGQGDDEIIVTLPKLEAGFEWWIEYYAMLREGDLSGVASVSSQAEVVSNEVDSALSDDPDTTAVDDATVIEVVVVPTATQEPLARPTNTTQPTRTIQATVPAATATATRTPTITPQPLSVTNTLLVSNGDYGSNNVWVEHQDGIFADTPAGRYQCELGFFNAPAAQQALQAAWNEASRGGANWRMRIVVRGSQSWVTCGNNPTCFDNIVEDTGQAELKVEVYMQPAVWNSLASSYAAGGYGAMIANEYYDDMQGMIFQPMGATTPSSAVIGIKFTRVN